MYLPHRLICSAHDDEVTQIRGERGGTGVRRRPQPAQPGRVHIEPEGLNAVHRCINVRHANRRANPSALYDYGHLQISFGEDAVRSRVAREQRELRRQDLSQEGVCLDSMSTQLRAQELRAGRVPAEQVQLDLIPGTEHVPYLNLNNGHHIQEVRSANGVRGGCKHRLIHPLRSGHSSDVVLQNGRWQLATILIPELVGRLRVIHVHLSARSQAGPIPIGVHAGPGPHRVDVDRNRASGHGQRQGIGIVGGSQTVDRHTKGGRVEGRRIHGTIENGDDLTDITLVRAQVLRPGGEHGGHGVGVGGHRELRQLRGGPLDHRLAGDVREERALPQLHNVGAAFGQRQGRGQDDHAPVTDHGRGLDRGNLGAR